MAKKKNDKPTAAEVQGIKTWVNVVGRPGDHGDVIRIGFEDGKCYLVITNDGFPTPGASGGMTVTIPGHIVRGNRLDARKFAEFYRSVYPCGVPIDDFSDPIWIYEPTPGRPEGTIEIIRHLSTRENRDGAAFGFEKTIVKRELVKAEGQLYLRVTDYECASGANGRPLYSFFEDYYVAYTESANLITAESGLKYAARSAAYRYEERGTGVLF